MKPTAAQHFRRESSIIPIIYTYEYSSIRAIIIFDAMGMPFFLKILLYKHPEGVIIDDQITILLYCIDFVVKVASAPKTWISLF
jgi:hypothetical protein